MATSDGYLLGVLSANVAAISATPWPNKLAEQIAAVRDLVARGAAAWTTEDVAAAFKGAKTGDVEPVLESLAALGIVVAYEAEGAKRWRGTRAAA